MIPAPSAAAILSESVNQATNSEFQGACQAVTLLPRTPRTPRHYDLYSSYRSLS